MKHIELVEISKSYDGKNKVIDKISVEVEKGEFFVLVGPSGCGKSTLLRMIAGLEEISGGLLKIDDVVVNDMAPKDRNISFVFQNYALYPHMTVRENILFGLDLKKVSKDDQNKRLMETAEVIGLTELLDRKPGQLSGGQRQRVALARSICSRASICLMDEPLSNLDAKLRAHMRTEIRRIHDKFKLTTIYVTHDQVEAMTMGDKIMVLNGGSIQQVGSPLDLYNTPANKFVASFIGSPQMNISDAIVRDDSIVINNEITITIDDSLKGKLLNGKKYIIGIRPESLIKAEFSSSISHGVVVEGVELLGNETQVLFKVGEKTLIARWPGQWRLNKGDTVFIEFNTENIHFFDIETEELINFSENIKKATT